tara:strand:- start:585 stop:773 length:189 start_codon:yes stop_codon:yes gene_type:complete
MTVQELINKLQTLDPKSDVLIEVNHDDIVLLREERIDEEYFDRDNRLATEECDTRKVVLIRL